jgi:hypothetical protein
MPFRKTSPQKTIPLPAGIARVSGRQAFSDNERGLVAFQRRRQLALFDQHIADLGVPP